MRRRTFTLTLLLLLIGSKAAFCAPVLPKPWEFKDLPTWDTGVRGGIPDVEVAVTISEDDLLNSRNTAITIQGAIDSVSDQGAVLLPKGEYTLHQPIYMRSGVVLRGAGVKHTKLIFDLKLPEQVVPFEMPAGGSIRFEGNQETNGRPIEGDHFKGEQTIRSLSLAGINVGDTIEVFSENDPFMMYTESRWKRPWAEQALGQLVRVTQIGDHELRIDTPLRLNFFKELNPRIRKLTPIENAGLESMSLVRIDNTPDSSVGFEKALNCWIKDCESTMTTRGHIWINRSRFITVQGNTVHHAFSYGSGGSGYGLVAGNIAVDCLFVDNITHNLRHSLMAKKGSNGNVFAYNYSFQRRRDPEGEKLLCDISLHGHYPHQNLFEGNVVEFVDIADHWGPTGPNTTLFRNYIREGIIIRDHSHHTRIIGNVITEGSIESDITVQYTSLVQNSVLSDTEYKDAVIETPLPASLIYQKKPEFWNSLPWPAIGPGTDLNREILIPAQERWFNHASSSKRDQ